MKLKSNFRDSAYDYAFDNEGPVFERINDKNGLSRRTQFRLLESVGFKVPPHGKVNEVLGWWWPEEKGWIREVVAYEDEQAHCTEGKIVLNEHKFQLLGALINGGPEAWRLGNLFCSAFVGHSWARPSISWRRLQIGKYVFWLECKGNESWMSNYGDGSWEVIGQESGLHDHLTLPLFALDFVLGKEMYAVDYNTAPGIGGCGVEKFMSGKEIVDALKEVVR